MEETMCINKRPWWEVLAELVDTVLNELFGKKK
jgi:hypothetical protein